MAIDINMKEQQEEAYAQIQARMVPNTILMKYIDQTLGDPAAIWTFKHAFATQLGMNFLFCYMLNVKDRYPQKFCFSRESARICLTEMRPHYAERYQERGVGVIDKHEIDTYCEDCRILMIPNKRYNGGLSCPKCNKQERFKEVPLRFTSNLQTIVPPFLTDGVLATTMGSSALALHSRLDILRPYLYLLFRDDLVAWWMNMKSSQRPVPEQDQQRRERDSLEYLQENIRRVTARLSFCSPILPDENTSTSSGSGSSTTNNLNANNPPVDQKIHQLLEVSRSHKRISHKKIDPFGYKRSMN